MTEVEKERFYNDKNLSNPKSKEKENDISFSSEERRKSDLKRTFEERHQEAVLEVSSWPDWQVKSMQMIFPERIDWKIKGQPSPQVENSCSNRTFEERHQEAVSEVSSWPDWQVKSMQMIFPERKDWKIKV